MYNNTQQRFFHFWSAVVQTIGNWCARSLPRFLGQQRMSVLGISNKVMFHRLHGAFPLTRTHTQHPSFWRLDEWQQESGSEHQDSDAEGWLGAPLRVRSCDWAMSAKALWIFSSSISPRKTTSSRRAAASWFSSSSCRRLAAWQQICLWAKMATGSVCARNETVPILKTLQDTQIQTTHVMWANSENFVFPLCFIEIILVFFFL